MRMRVAIPVMILSSLFLPLKIEKFRNIEPKVSVAQAYDPLTAEFIDFRKGMAILDTAGLNASYETLHKRLVEAGFSIPYAPPKKPIKPEEIVFPIEIDGYDKKWIMIIEKSERAYILYQLLTGRKNISRRGIDEIRYAFDKKILFSGAYDDIDTLNLRYVLNEGSIACLEFTILCSSILYSYGMIPEIHVLISRDKGGGHAFVVMDDMIFDDELSGRREAVERYYKREWGDYKEYILTPSER
jgi:hypothetical protein